MAQTATITDKRQFTIPIETYKKLGFQEGSKVVITYKGNKMIVEPASKVLDRLAKSVTIPKRFRGMPLDVMIQKAKEEHFKKNA